jgi:glycosyltransferase involved in cell wall biosynthesis
MRICFISFEYPPFLIGGAGIYAIHITKELAKLGHEVHVISPIIRNQKMVSFEDTVFVHRIPTIHKRFLRAPSFWLNLTRKYSTLREEIGGFDVIHSNGMSDLSLSKQKVKEPRVTTVHHLAYSVSKPVSFTERLLELNGETGLASLFEKHVIHRADKIIAVSDFTKNDLLSTYSEQPSKIEVIYNGVCPADFTISPEEVIKTKAHFDLENKTTFLFVGRINDKRKGLPLLLKAFKILSERETFVKLMIVGSGDQTSVRALVELLGLQKYVVFTGYVTDKLLKMIYCACDVFVFPSMLEGFGLVVLDAMASGKPVVCMNRGAIPELVRDGVNGLLVNKPDPRELATAMAFFVDHPSTITEMGQRNREWALNFSWVKSAKLTEQVYKSMLNFTR